MAVVLRGNDDHYSAPSGLRTALDQDLWEPLELDVPLPPQAPITSRKQTVKEPSAATSQAAVEEYVVEVTKTAKQSKIGLEVDWFFGRVLITHVKEGLIDDYNQKAKEQGLREVRVGDHILGVNGVTENPQKILKVIGGDPVLTLTISGPKQSL
mmetsp:Transcript_45133/g.98103  ORF Transcript_45133/g.98103 Transcript_45133/m.98103 type:complete len:154 (+) Transcript_45133:54-515(+)|eukprot:CAMPEP_0170616628 /NCGR_PEP_ID=MMETSP0224-20130122/25970_1 /TAXON_ID=285029 /ORGANISM="Togula jolla, Strain CCCM 725" /LENGTH=153 /DNA_ID=CAMNT_0010942435 /DNA_START=49 /DNA_END=510 /DNA_ORIENTATION=-